MKKENIILIGAGGHCHSVIDVIEQENRYTILGLVDTKENIGKEVLGYKVIGCDEDLPTLFKECKLAHIAIGHLQTNTQRLQLCEQLTRIGFQFPTIISPLAYVSKHAVVQEGTIVMHHALINANAKVGKHSIINSKALLEHDSIVEDFCHIATASVVNGGVTIAKNSFFGSNATSKQGIHIDGFIKAGSVVK